MCPMFWAEIARANNRGSIVVFYAFAHTFGSFIAGFVTYATQTRTTEAAWRIPIAVMFAFPCLVLGFSWYLPESPRWLVRRNERDKAVKALQFLQGARPGYDADREATLLQASLEEDQANKGRWRDIFKQPSAVCIPLPMFVTCKAFIG